MDVETRLVLNRHLSLAEDLVAEDLGAEFLLVDSKGVLLIE